MKFAFGNRQERVAFVSFYQAQARAFETQPLEITDGLKNCLKTMPLNFTITLNQLPPGDYTCQVTVLDPTGQKSNILAGSSRTCPVTSHPALSLPVTLHLRRSRSWKPGNS